MKVMLLWGAVALAVLVVGFALILGRTPAGGPAHSVDMPLQTQTAGPAANLCEGLTGDARQRCIEQHNLAGVQIDGGATTPAREAVASEGAARAQRGSGVEGVPSSGITVAPRQ